MQYFKLQGDCFVGDAMPFFHDGVFRLFYLRDEQHHAALDGLGGHQWVQASSRDLITWEQHPLAIAITEGWEGSICTGSVLFHEGVYYAFYATRMPDWTQHLSLATSHDGVHFDKTAPNPFASPPAGYDPLHYHDPVVFQDAVTRTFHMLVTACLRDWPIADRGGCLAHLVSSDLQHWEQRAPFIIPGLPGVPECPDYLAWNGWYYLVFSNGGIARYRMARQPFGSWLRPPVDTLDGPAARVMKTAPFHDGRRLGVAWLGTRRDNTDNGSWQFGGNAVFRELVQHPDGTLGARFPDELTPTGVPLTTLDFQSRDPAVTIMGKTIQIGAHQGLAAAACASVPRNARIVMRVLPSRDAGGFGARLRPGARFDTGYGLHIAPYDRIVTLATQAITGVTGLNKPFTLEIVLKDDIIDVCIDRRRTLLDRCPEQRGDTLLLYAEDAAVTFEIIEFAALTKI